MTGMGSGFDIRFLHLLLLRKGSLTKSLILAVHQDHLGVVPLDLHTGGVGDGAELLDLSFECIA